MHRLSVALALILAILPVSARADDPGDLARLIAHISPESLMNTVRDLVRFDGRQSGTPSGTAAAEYIAAHLPEASFQAFSVKTIQTDTPLRVSIKTGASTKLLEAGRDFLPVVNAASAVTLSTPIVFVGYGIDAAAQGLDEYAGLSVRGKIVLFLRGQPKGWAGRVSHIDKVHAARAKGAVGYLTVSGPVLSAYEQRRGLGVQPLLLYEGTDDEQLPGLWLDPSVADMILSPSGLTLRAFQEEMDRTIALRSFETGVHMTMGMHQRRVEAPAANVLGRWAGSDAALSGETIVLGAHHDHFGTQAGLVFPGADDNASGTAILLEIARVLSAMGIKPRRTVLFLSFAGEEQGLLGSKLYVSRPIVSMQMVRAMINVDHAGVGNGKLTVGLSKIEKGIAQEAAGRIGMADRLELFGLFPGGDHVPFAEAGVPAAAIVTSGPHPDFHRPSDTPDRLNPELLASAARYALALVWMLANP